MIETRPVRSMKRSPAPPLLRRLAWFRYEIRRFLSFSEAAARAEGITPKQHQLLLGVAGFTGRGWATISELAEYLQARHNAVVTLVQRGASRGLVRREPGPDDRRYARVRLTARGEAVLGRLARIHVQEIRRIGTQVRAVSDIRPRLLRHGRS